MPASIPDCSCPSYQWPSGQWPAVPSGGTGGPWPNYQWPIYQWVHATFVPPGDTACMWHDLQWHDLQWHDLQWPCEEQVVIVTPPEITLRASMRLGLPAKMAGLTLAPRIRTKVRFRVLSRPGVTIS